MTEGHVIFGRKDICKYLKLSWKTILKYKRRHGLPLVQAPGCPPMIHTAAVRIWFNEKFKKENKLP